MSNLTLAQQIGQRLVIGFPGHEIPDEVQDLVKRHHIGSFILFEHNVSDRFQLRDLCNELQMLALEANGMPAFITIDQEGGVVTRLREDAAVVPSPMCVSATGDPENAYAAGLITGRELRAIGVNFNLAPCLDVNSNPHNPVIGVRSYGDTPETVSAYGNRMIRGLLDSGVLCCAKHFPGHGDTAVDSHLGLPTVDKSLRELEACELKPFAAAIEEGVPAVMTAHILFPQIEPEPIPATMSRRIITGLLKEKLGFTGLVLSDCMMMQAIQAYYGTVKGVVAAMGAGVDVVFVSHDARLAAEACIAVGDAIQDGRLSREEMDDSVNKILTCKQSLAKACEDLSIVGCEAHREAVRGMMERGLTLVQATVRKSPLQRESQLGKLPPLGDSPLFLGCHPFVPIVASNPEDKSISFPHTMRDAFGGDALITSIDPTAGEIAALISRAAGHSSVVMGTYNGHIKTGQLDLVRALAGLQAPVICVALRNPYDLLALPDNVTCIAAYAYDRLSMEAVVKLLRGELQPVGRLPLRNRRR